MAVAYRHVALPPGILDPKAGRVAILHGPGTLGLGLGLGHGLGLEGLLLGLLLGLGLLRLGLGRGLGLLGLGLGTFCSLGVQESSGLDQAHCALVHGGDVGLLQLGQLQWRPESSCVQGARELGIGGISGGINPSQEIGQQGLSGHILKALTVNDAWLIKTSGRGI